MSTEWLFYNLAHPTPYPWYKEKLPALEDNFYQLTRNISDKKILKKVSVKILHALHADRLIFPLSANRVNFEEKAGFSQLQLLLKFPQSVLILDSHILYI